MIRRLDRTTGAVVPVSGRPRKITPGTGELFVQRSTGRLCVIHDDGTIVDLEDWLSADSVPQVAHGWPLAADGTRLVTLSYSESTRTLTITAVSGATFDVYVLGTKYTFASPRNETHADTDGAKFLLVNSSGSFVWQTTAWGFHSEVPTFYVYYNATANVAPWALNELHGAGRSIEWHQNQHETEGTKLALNPALSVSGYTLTTDTEAAVTFALSTVTVHDEDIDIDTGAKTDGSTWRVMYRDGASGIWNVQTSTFGGGSGVPFLTDGTTICVNTISGGVWTKVPVTLTGSGTYVNAWVFATTEVTATRRFFVVASQVSHTTQAAATAAAAASDIAAWGILPTELVAVAQVTYYAKSAFAAASLKTQIVAVQVLSGTRAQLLSSPSSGLHATLGGLGWTASGHTAAATGTLPYWSAPGTPAELAPGTDGYVLTLASGVPSWAAASGGLSVTTKGDLQTFSTVAARLPVGTNGQVLSADSSTTTGLKWITIVAAMLVLDPDGGIDTLTFGDDPYTVDGT